MFIEATDRPEASAFQRLLLILAGVMQCGALVECEDDVSADLVLDLHRHLWCESMHRSIEVRLECDSIIVDMGKALLLVSDDVICLPKFGVHGDDLLEAHAEGEHLEPTAIGEGGTLPIHESSKATCLIDRLGSWLKVEVIGVGEDCLRTQSLHVLGEERLDRSFGADRDECGSLDHAMWSMDLTGPTEMLLMGRVQSLLLEESEC